MKTGLIVCTIAMALMAASALAKPSSPGGSHHVAGHVTKAGTYVPPHRQTNPNGTQRDNWSSKPNTNPYTGKDGTKEPTK